MVIFEMHVLTGLIKIIPINQEGHCITLAYVKKVLNLKHIFRQKNSKNS